MSMLGGAVLVVLLAGYFAQQYLPPPKPKIVGIDLGKIPNCCVSNYVHLLWWVLNYRMNEYAYGILKYFI